LVGSTVAAVDYMSSDPRERGMAAGMYSLATDGAHALAPLFGGGGAERIGLAATLWAMPPTPIAVYSSLLAASACRGGRPAPPRIVATAGPR
jgi:hypothetical protein